MNFCLRECNKTYSDVKSEMNTIRVHIDIIRMCDNYCKYCYARHDLSEWGLVMSNQYIDDVLIPKLESLSRSGKHLDIVLLGGEPTLHPRFCDLLSILSKFSRISITSNGNCGYCEYENSEKIRWAFTYHPSQHQGGWIEQIVERKDDFWEVAVSPLIDCTGNVELFSRRVYDLIQICHSEGIKVQPTFQFDPSVYPTHIDMRNVRKYYSYLADEFPIYTYFGKNMNDYNILKEKMNYIKGCLCINNNVQLSVKGILRRCCSNEILCWNDLPNLDSEMICPLPECTCYGFLSLHKSV